ncbi:alpha/beta-hydrolase [Saitoella complicata NRRL Y-17804]|nr:alpha/beta-hydrolase [Saitoella complicata NRRL Y-17804]ODQ52658.1 alpha/beta-hydrolase [Saitoella complicata NRRL Y-17804]
MPDGSTQTITHPTLGCTLKGIQVNPNVIEYRGIPYARITERFADPEPVNRLEVEGGVYDATKFGAVSPQPPHTAENELAFLGATLPVRPLDQDEFGCLNINVSVPTGTLSTKGLPVLLFIHGGAYRFSAATLPQHDVTSLCSLSHTLNKPTIIVSFNYRLGLFGFLSSRDVGVSGNAALKDHIAALRWVRRHIAGFGGDVGNVTVFGESAGGAAVDTLLHSKVPEVKGAFRRACMMSGSVALMGVAPPAVHERLVYDKLCVALSIPASLSPVEKLAKLRAAPVETLVNLGLALPAMPVVDGTYIPDLVTWDNMEDTKVPAWCESVMVGDCKDDGWVYALLRPSLLKDQDMASTLAKALASAFGADGKELAKLLGLLDDFKGKQDALRRGANAIGELSFCRAAAALARTWSQKKAYLYHFDQPSTWAGPNEGMAHHALDIVYLFQSYHSQFTSPSQVALSKQMGAMWIAFANGEEPWSPYKVDDGRKAMCIGPGECRVKTEKEDDREGRRGEAWRVMERIGVGKVWELFQGVMYSVKSAGKI